MFILKSLLFFLKAEPLRSADFPFLFLFFFPLFYFCLCWVFVAVRALSSCWEWGILSCCRAHTIQFSSVSVTPWTAARQTSLSITNCWSLPKPMSIEPVMPSNHLILLSPSPPALNLSQHQGPFRWVSSSHQMAKVLEFQLQHQSFQWIPRTDLL